MASGYSECICCSDIIVVDDENASELCDDCVEAGCEPSCGGEYLDCEIPSCPECDTRSTLCTDGQWHRNCTCGEAVAS